MSKWCFWFLSVFFISSGRIWLNNGLVLKFLVLLVIWWRVVFFIGGVLFLILSKSCMIFFFLSFFIVKIFLLDLLVSLLKYVIFLGLKNCRLFIFGILVGIGLLFRCIWFGFCIMKFDWGVGVCISLCVGVCIGLYFGGGFKIL